MSDSPTNSGPMFSISPRMQPAAQTSIAKPYTREPKSSSGARYHRVPTCDDSSRGPESAPALSSATGASELSAGSESMRARPKSASLSTPEREMSRFGGLMSR
eukprot:Amastigsp_a177868_6.p6 type:complete len:103 gc:universal Amastigsp_a177868_6:740-432(-)